MSLSMPWYSVLPSPLSPFPIFCATTVLPSITPTKLWYSCSKSVSALSNPRAFSRSACSWVREYPWMSLTDKIAVYPFNSFSLKRYSSKFVVLERRTSFDFLLYFSNISSYTWYLLSPWWLANPNCCCNLSATYLDTFSAPQLLVCMGSIKSIE